MRIVDRHAADATQLVQILREVQASFRHIPADAMDSLAAALGIERAQVQAVAEFYTFFSTKPRGRYDILISDSITDHMLGSREIAAYLSERLGIQPGETRSDGQVSFDYTSCTGMCEQGPAGLVNGLTLTQLTRERIDRIVDLVNAGTPVTQWPREFFAVKDNIRRADLILKTELKPGSALKWSNTRGADSTLAEIEKSGLRGRGGAGFSTGMKWKFCRQAKSGPADAPAERYVVCNADEGEPGTFKDRVLLQSYADQVFEGMTLCGRVIGARQGYLYLRGEYLYLGDHLDRVLQERRRNHLLGSNILGEPGFDFDIEVRIGAGAYICGEESALIESLEGKRGVPRNRPPYPVTHGYRNKPTVVNNVETFAAAALIGLKGGAWFADVGTEKSKGTKILSISGDCAKPGIYEYPFGTSIRKILDDCGATNTLGLQIGGPSGIFISDREFDRVLGFEDLPTGGSFMIFDRTRDILEIVRNFTHFFAHESCGFCTPCRVGTSLLRNQLDKLCAGHGAKGDLVELTHISKLVKNTSHCGLGQTAANPILSTLERYPELYEQRLRAKAFEPGFDLDGALEVARRMAGRDDAHAHLEQEAVL
ncbi:MAG: NAD(P)H-dependent oxidoreductase subunit E [Methylotetracoccus sp.]|nr:NAD(P)H-dependent oxidoreductase subunit E [Methylotetracoccus sp.]